LLMLRLFPLVSVSRVSRFLPAPRRCLVLQPTPTPHSSSLPVVLSFVSAITFFGLYSATSNRIQAEDSKEEATDASEQPHSVGEEFDSLEEYIRSKVTQKLQRIRQQLKDKYKKELDRIEEQLEDEHSQRLAVTKRQQLDSAQEFVIREKRKLQLVADEQVNKYAHFAEEKLNQQQQQAIELLAAVQQRLLRLEALQDTATPEQLQHTVGLQQLCAGLFATIEAIQRVRPFRFELDRLRAASKGHRQLESVLASIPNSVAEQGLPTDHQLYDDFRRVKLYSRRAQYVPEQGGVGWRLLSLLLATVTFEEKGLVQGSHPDAVLARAEYYLEHGDLEQSVKEMEKLNGLVAFIARQWVSAARHRLQVDRSLGAARALLSRMIAADE